MWARRATGQRVSNFNVLRFHPGRCLPTLALLLSLSLGAHRNPPVNRHSALHSFTHLVTRLLEDQLDLQLGGIQVYPTNQYTPAVHRILQVSANLHESAKPHAPGGYFEDEGDILQVEELSVESPFLNRSDTQAIHGITDEAYEAAALQLLPKLRPDSVGKWGIRGGRSYLHFSGAEGSWYRVESSTDLIHWKPILTGRAGHAGLELSPDCSDPCAFYRSVRLDGGNHRRQPGSHVRPARSSEEGRDPR